LTARQYSDERVDRTANPILAALAALPRRPYPAGFDTFASCHESYTEAKNVDADYLGKTLDKIRVEEIAEALDTPFLRVEPMAYFWPKILAALYLYPDYPDSDFALWMYALTFRRWGRTDPLTGRASGGTRLCCGSSAILPTGKPPRRG
jgi:hypothetical protein